MNKKYVIITPCYNEGEGIILFLKELELVVKKIGANFVVVITDDSSEDNTLALLKDFNFESENISKKLITLAYNVGHQKAIAHGLAYAKKIEADGYIIMDSDGEDNPAAIPQLIAIQNFDIIFVVRGTRTEGILFKLGYFFYKLIIRIITNRVMNFGNYSMINKNVLNIINNQSFVHFPAFVTKLRFNKQSIVSDRGKRLKGKSKMNYNSLVLFGLKALIEFSEELLLFFIKLFIVVILFVTVVGIVILYKKFISHEAVLGWASTLGMSLINSCLIILGIIVIGLLLLNINDKKNSKNDIYTEIE